MHLASIDDARLLAARNSGLPACFVTGGVWVDDQALMVNRDYDFGAALGLEGLGPAVAAGARKEANASVAADLRNMPSLELGDAFSSTADQSGECRGNSAKHPTDVAVFGLLYGGMRDGASTRLLT